MSSPLMHCFPYLIRVSFEHLKLAAHTQVAIDDPRLSFTGFTQPCHIYNLIKMEARFPAQHADGVLSGSVDELERAPALADDELERAPALAESELQSAVTATDVDIQPIFKAAGRLSFDLMPLQRCLTKGLHKHLRAQKKAGKLLLKQRKEEKYQACLLWWIEMTRGDDVLREICSFL